jgi:hypothetical protein
MTEPADTQNVVRASFAKPAHTEEDLGVRLLGMEPDICDLVRMKDFALLAKTDETEALVWFAMERLGEMIDALKSRFYELVK